MYNLNIADAQTGLPFLIRPKWLTCRKGYHGALYWVLLNESWVPCYTCDTLVTSVYVLFNEGIPERSADYFRELDKATVKVYPEERQVSEIDWLVGQNHMGERLLYKTTRVDF